MTLPISLFIVACNEADRIERTLRAVAGLCADIVVVDSGSSDGTPALAAALGAQVVTNPWPGYGRQKNFAQDLCRHDWVLNLDADEVVSDDLRNEIRALFEHGDPTADAFVLRIVDVLPGDVAPRPLAYTYHRVRLYRKHQGRFSLSPVHDTVDLQPGARTAHLRGMIHHHSMRNLGEQLAKFNSYSDALVADLEQRGKRLPGWRLFVEFPLAFLKSYLLRRQFMGGRYGFLIAMNYAYFRHLRVAKHYEARRARRLQFNR